MKILSMVEMSRIKRGPWSYAEDRVLMAYIQSRNYINWSSLPEATGILRSSKSCRLRAKHLLDMDQKRGDFTDLEVDLMAKLHGVLGDRWADIAAELPGRTDIEVENYWKKHFKKTSPYDIMSNDVVSSLVSEIPSKFSSKARGLLCPNLTLEPNNDFGQHQDICKDPSFDLATFGPKFEFGLDDHPDQFSGSKYEDLMDKESMLWLSTLVDEDIVGPNTSLIAPPVIQGGPQAQYAYGTDTILNDNDDEQRNGEIGLSLDVIKQHFHMSMEDAVHSLKVSRSTLKRICRKYDIKRWPYRKRKEINSTKCSVENKLSNLMNAPGYESNVIDTCSTTVNIKVTYKDDIIRFSLPVSARLDDLIIKISKRLNLETHTFKLTYVDDVYDFILIACDEDLQDRLYCILAMLRADSNSTLNIFVFPV